MTCYRYHHIQGGSRLEAALGRGSRISAGFTLIEVMIVTAIIGVIAAIAIPAYNGYIKQSRISSLVHNWDAAISTVRTEAAHGSSCRDVITMLNSGGRKGVGNSAVSAFVTSGSSAGTVVISGLGGNNCPENGESITVTAIPSAGTGPADYPGGSAPTINFTIDN